MNEPDPGMRAVKAKTQLNVWPKLCRAKSVLVFVNSFSLLELFKADCEAEELVQGLHLFSLTKDTGLEKDFPASRAPRVCYEPPTSSTSEAGLLDRKVKRYHLEFIHLVTQKHHGY